MKTVSNFGHMHKDELFLHHKVYSLPKVLEPRRNTVSYITSKIVPIFCESLKSPHYGIIRLKVAIPQYLASYNHKSVSMEISGIIFSYDV